MEVFSVDRPEDKYIKIPALVHASRIGYDYISIRGLKPGDDYDSDTNIFYEPFRSALSCINGQEVDEQEARHLVAELRHKLDADDLGKAFFACLQTGIEGYRLVDFDNPANNTFRVATELSYADGKDSFRPDITFLLNGLPLAFMEVKQQNNKDGIQAERNRMAKRFGNPIYRRFVNVTQVTAFSNNQEYDDEDRHKLQGSFYASSAYGPLDLNHFREEDGKGMASLVAERNSTSERFICKDNNLASFYGSAEYESSIGPDTPANRIITSLFSPERFVFLLRYGICYVEKVNDKGVMRLQKHVMRYPQLFATKAVDRALSEGRRKGVIWHTQGSGKTALSFFLARYLRDWYQWHDTIARFFFIVDRLDLAHQAAEEFRSRGAQVNVVNSRKEFARTLKEAGDGTNAVGDGRAPVITVVNIQKFGEESTAAEFDYGLKVQRIYFIDEAHRDYKCDGEFLASLMASDREAVKFALTGTPLVDGRHGNATKQVFGPYIHKYFYNQSIADGYTLKLLREGVRTEFKVHMQEVMEELREIKELVNLVDVFEHENYVKPLCEYIVRDYLESKIALEDETIGAMVVAYSSGQARAIYRHLSEFDPDFGIELVADEDDFRRVESALVLHDEGSEEDRRKICDSFKKEDSPIDILVVHRMLLTGFDAPRLKKLYLCRSGKGHNLLQMLTRVNRPYKDMAYGHVVDFADITEEYDKANRAYLAELTEELGNAVDDYSSLFEDSRTIEEELGRIKNALFSYTIDNVVEFQKEIDAIGDKSVLYGLRTALKRYRSLRNLARAYGFEQLHERFGLERAAEMLRTVENRIRMLNNKQALKLKGLSTGDLNVLLDRIEFEFRRIGKDELKIADEFQDKLRRTYRAFASNIDNDDPEYVNLLETLRKKFEELDIEEMTSEEMTASIRGLDDLRRKMDELNRKDALLVKEYNGDAKFARAHKKALRTPPPLTKKQKLLSCVLNRVKNEADQSVMNNHNLLGNSSYFEKSMQKMLLASCRQEGLQPSADQVRGMAAFIAGEYIDERNKVA